MTDDEVVELREWRPVVSLHLIWHKMPVPPIAWERIEDTQGNVCAAYDALNLVTNPVQYWTYQRSK